MAIPRMVQTAERLRQSGIAARALFVDIDVPPLGVVRFRRPGAAAAMALQAAPHHGHGELDRIAAMRALAKKFDGRLVVAARGDRGARARRRPRARARRAGPPAAP